MAPKPKKTPAFKFLPASLCDAFNNVWICEISGYSGGEYSGMYCRVMTLNLTEVSEMRTASVTEADCMDRADNTSLRLVSLVSSVAVDW
jgi:hypothetical protein